ncbi:MAG: prepilin peptidase [Caldisericia bacterium]|nr:prepilin peptidase [Caldisericia bacterium]
MIIFIFVLGLIVGSFLNCVILRTYKGESFIVGRSYCPKCKHDLKPWDLIPVLSYLILRGKCRYCGNKISFQYPLVELSTAIIFSFVYLQVGLTSEMIYLLAIMAIFIVIFVYDLKYYIIPDKFVFSGIILSAIWVFLTGDILITFASAIGASLFFFLIWFFSKGLAMGFGDVKLAFLIGLLLGWPNVIVGLFLGFFFGAIIGTISLLINQKNLKSEIPFAPFLLSGAFVALFWGDKIVQWYLSLIK